MTQISGLLSAAACASASILGIPIIGFFNANAIALIVVRPIRRPVNEPGPRPTEKRSISSMLNEFLDNNLSISRSISEDCLPGVADVNCSTNSALRPCSGQALRLCSRLAAFNKAMLNLRLDVSADNIVISFAMGYECKLSLFFCCYTYGDLKILRRQ